MFSNFLRAASLRRTSPRRTSLRATSLSATLIALSAAASVICVDTAPALSLSLVCPQGTVTGVENLKVVANLTNTGDQALKIFKGPLVVLDNSLPTDKFVIINAEDLSPDFIGVSTKYSPPLPDTSTNLSDVVTLTPGQSVVVTHDLSLAYNFTNTGNGTYTIDAYLDFHALDPNNELFPVIADSDACTVTLVGGPLVAATPAASTPPVPFTNCTADQQSALTAAATAAQSLAEDALTYLRTNTASTPRYMTWFGEYTDERHHMVKDNFEALSASNFTGFNYDCTCTHDAVYAYVYPSQFGTVYLCGAFWDAPATGTDSQAGALVFEAADFAVDGGITRDPISGRNLTMRVAQNYPDTAVISAAPYEYFAENSPALS